MNELNEEIRKQLIWYEEDELFSYYYTYMHAAFSEYITASMILNLVRALECKTTTSYQLLMAKMCWMETQCQSIRSNLYAAYEIFREYPDGIKANVLGISIEKENGVLWIRPSHKVRADLFSRIPRLHAALMFIESCLSEIHPEDIMQMAANVRSEELNRKAKQLSVELVNLQHAMGLEIDYEAKTIHFLESPTTERICFVCRKPTSLLCANCQLACYCSRECQKSVWKVHKKACFALFES
jgi:hypothetical protein